METVSISILAIALGYLLGSIPTAYIAGCLRKGVDVRKVGGGNVGAVNTFREIGAREGIIVLLVDIAKGAAAIFIAQALVSSLLVAILAGVAVVVGHSWPVFLRFRGGKGAATTIGVFLALTPGEMLIALGIMAIPIFITHNPTLSMAIGFIFLPLLAWGFGETGELIASSAALPIFVGLRYLPVAREAFAKAENKKDFIIDRWQRGK